ncbi:MAG: hypothetical protein ACRD3C_12990 [Vicinamibacterales bacterium]
MASAVLDVFNFLIAQNLVGGTTGWAILRRRLMDAPVGDKLVIVGEDGGNPPEMPATGGIGSAVLADKGVLVTVRAAAADSDASFQKASDILVALHGLRGATLVSGGELYFGVRALTPEPVFAGFDDRGRPLHTVAFRLLGDAANL